MISFLDMKAQYASIKNEVDSAVLNVLANCQFVLGKEVADFEERFADYCEVKHAVALNSGTSALHLALLAAGIGPGDEVITVGMTFVASVAAILYAGAKPVLVDVDPATWNLDPQQLAKALTPCTKAIIPVHLHGLMADMDPICEFAKQHGLVVIEDACQAHGAAYKGKRAGSMGLMSAFSFYPGKNLGAYGEAGALVTQDAELAKTVRMLRDFGQDSKYHHKLRGYNYRMEAIQGAVLGVKLNYLERWTEQRRQVAQWYFKHLKNNSALQIPSPLADSRHVYHVFAVLTEARDKVQQQLQEQGIGTNIHYPIPVHLQPAYADLGYRQGSLPVSERLAKQFLSLPMYPELTAEQVAQVCAALQQTVSVSA
jgi:dTDP-4-amino-4,6-dideoxygalactose transaminase